MMRVARNVFAFAAVAGAIVLGKPQTTKADHACGSGGYYQADHVTRSNLYDRGPVYYRRPVYQPYDHSYPFSHRHYSYYRPAPHIDVSVHTRYRTYSHHGRHGGHHRD